MNDQILSALNRRYATKLFNPDKKVSDSDLDILLEAVRLAPSSLGIQPWRVIVIVDKEMKTRLKAAAYNQAQIGDASQVIVFTSRKSLDEHYVDSYLENVMKVRNQKNEDVQGYKKMIMNSYANRTPEGVKEWNSRQAYIALGILLETAALMNIDACPMEGFDIAQFDRILGLEKTEYSCAVIAAIGYRSENDKYAFAKKVRFCKEELIVKI